MEHHIDPPITERIEGNRFVLRTTPRRSAVFSNILVLLKNNMKEKGGWFFMRGLDVHLNEENIYIPDIMIVLDRDKIQDDGIHGAPDLVVEILDPTTAFRIRGPKMTHYAAAGVKEYWIVSPLAKSVEVYLNEGGRFRLDYIYTDYNEEDLSRMEEKDRAALRWEIPVSLYDDFLVDVKEVFDDVDDFA